MKHVNVIVKATNACNLRCKYCYNKDADTGCVTLPLAKLEKFLAVLAHDYQSIDLIWHGGEPLMAGLKYMKEAMRVIDNVRLAYGVKVVNKMQTNGTLIDEKWVSFFKKHEIKVGISFDGMANDTYRQGTDKVLRAFELMRKKGVRFGTLAVVADDDCDLVENYKYFSSLRLSTDFSPIFMEGGARTLPSLSADKYASELIRLFDHWLYDRNGVGVRLFSSYVTMALGKRSRICTNSSCIGSFFSIYPDGEIYNCGRSSMMQYPFGNIDDIETMKDIFSSKGFHDLLVGSIARRETCKETCEFFPYCCGGCSDQAVIDGALNAPPTFFCSVFKTVFSHIRTTMDRIVADAVPLNELNPEMRKIWIDCFRITNDLGERK